MNARGVSDHFLGFVTAGWLVSYQEKNRKPEVVAANGPGGGGVGTTTGLKSLPAWIV